MIQNQLLRGSFRGVNFNFEEIAETSGRKVKIHEFVNSNKVIAEDLGQSANSISIRMILVADISSSNNVSTVDYFSKKKQILAALNAKGNGILVHPTRGQLNVSVLPPFIFTENISSLGRAAIDVTFIQVDEVKLLEPNTKSVDAIYKAGEEIIFSVLSPTEKFTILDAIGWNYVKDKFDSISNTLQNLLLSSGVVMAVDAYNELTSAIKASGDYYTTSLKAGIQNPIGLFFTYTGLYANNPFETFYFMKSWYDYGDNESEFQPTTISNDGLLENQDNFKQIIQTQSLMLSVNQAVLIDYQDDQQLQGIVDDINAQYDKVLELRKNAADDSVSAKIRAHKVLFNNYVKDLALTVPKITEIAVNKESLITLCYSYYDMLDNMAVIQGLNVFNDPSLIGGDIKILSA